MGMKAFAGDHNIKDEIIKLRDRFNISFAIETGTYMGDTAIELASIFNAVSTIEIDPDKVKLAEFNIFVEHGVSNIALFNCKSVDELQRLADNKSHRDVPIFFYLDAHWGGTPLLDEIRLAGQITRFPVIAIHDFKVPAGLGYDTYNGQEYTLEWITPALEECYPSGYDYHYNEVAEGAKRGVIYVYPNTKDDD